MLSWCFRSSARPQVEPGLRHRRICLSLVTKDKRYPLSSRATAEPPKMEEDLKSNVRQPIECFSAINASRSACAIYLLCIVVMCCAVWKPDSKRDQTQISRRHLPRIVTNTDDHRMQSKTQPKPYAYFACNPVPFESMLFTSDPSSLSNQYR